VLVLAGGQQQHAGKDQHGADMDALVHGVHSLWPPAYAAAAGCGAL
jgi:hypothetical protein